MPSNESKPVHHQENKTKKEVLRIPRMGSDFYELIKQSQLLAKSIRARLNPILPPLLDKPAFRLAKVLVDQRAITLWHAEEFLAGRSSLYVPGFKLLQPVECNDERCIFIAERLKQQQLVRLTITPTGSDALPSPTGVYRKIIRIYETGKTNHAQWVAENFIQGQSLAEVISKPNFQRGQYYELVRQCLQAFCHSQALAIDWLTLTADDILIDVYGEVHLRTRPLSKGFQDKQYEYFVLCVDRLFASSREYADEILTLLSKSQCLPGGTSPVENILKLIQRYSRPLVECVERPETALTRDYLRRFIRKSPQEQSIRAENIRGWQSFLHGEEQSSARFELSDEEIVAFFSDSAKATGMAEEANPKVRTRKGLPVKILVLMCALLLHIISFFHSHHTIPELSAEAEPEIRVIDQAEEPRTESESEDAL